MVALRGLTMHKYTGTLRYSDLAGGAWSLITDQGVVYQLSGGRGCVDGARAEVVGKIASDQMGITMIGDILKVERLRILA